MTRRTKVWIVAVLALVAYLIAGWFVGAQFSAPREALFIRIGFALLGIATAGVILWFAGGFRASAPAPESELAGVLRTAQNALTKVVGRDKKRRGVGAMPAVLVIGPTGSAKTTTIVRSDVAAELIAGEVQQGETVVPTRAANVWLAQETLFIEAADSVVSEAPEWKRLLRAARPRSFVAALTGRPQAPRFAVVCVSCEEFRASDAAERCPELARWLNARLSDISQEFGVTLPTYVLFTKMDSLPHFEAYVRNLSAEEAVEPMGASLGPMSSNGATGAYADRMTATLDRVFDGIFASLAERRLSYLQREHDEATKLKSYEFPREFRKITPLAVEFLRELARPSALRSGATLRGFYFVGVQPVFVSSGADAPMAAAAGPRPSPGAASATVVFSQPLVAAAARPAMEFAAPRMRKVPRWDFLPVLLREVVLGDAEAARATQQGTRIGGARHVMLGAAIAAALLLAVAFTTSFVTNRRLARSAQARAEAIRALPPNALDMPNLATLQKLDSLRETVETLSDYVHNGTPWRYRWGLSSVDGLYAALRPMYFGAFQRVMFGATRSALVSALRALPAAPTPNDDYGTAYNALKAYVIVTSEPRQSTRDFLSPVLQQHWLGGRELDPERKTLASKQFDLYASELAYENVFAESADIGAIARARTYLNQFAGADPIYQHLLTEAAKSKSNPAVQFNRLYPASGQVISVPFEVNGAFTKGGWEFMQNALAHVGQYFAGEKWVLGNQDSAPVDTAAVVKQLRERYTTDYVRAWRTFLQSATVLSFGDVRDAARKLAVLSGNQSPLLQVLSVTSQNTHVLPKIDSLFQPVQSLMPPTAGDKLIAPGNEPYMKALGQLLAAMEKTVSAQGAAQNQAAEEAVTAATTAKVAVNELAQKFAIDQQGQVDATVRRLLESPINNANLKVARFGAAKLNEAAGSFCSRAGTFIRSFPFSPEAPQQMSVQDFASFLKPGTGQLWAFYNQSLQQVLQKQGTIYVPAPDAKVSTGFVTFFNRAAQLSDALYSEDQQTARITLEAEPLVPEGGSTATIVLDGQSIVAGQNQAKLRLTWPGGGSGGVSRISARVRGTDIDAVNSFTGPWSALQLLYAAEWRTEGNGYRLEWKTTARNNDGTPLKLAARITAATPPAGSTFASLSNINALFHPRVVQGASCSDIAQ
jgi:type VI secretion system protein ImpL